MLRCEDDFVDSGIRSPYGPWLRASGPMRTVRVAAKSIHLKYIWNPSSLGRGRGKYLSDNPLVVRIFETLGFLIILVVLLMWLWKSDDGQAIRGKRSSSVALGDSRDGRGLIDEDSSSVGPTDWVGLS
ncbi:hypothetical protein Salat_0039300 [Sesamum alatum]|uniref:Uncharacterized protein n=1 Tax=Sesamum alatum TaxID=300844 RepID=A0AAE1YV35_9LAMI|nr:hypothetical protein Salat_0039300 [Sesamum alatum]